MEQVVLSWLAVKLVELLKSWSKVPWISQKTDAVNRVVSAVLAALATIGLSFHYDAAAGTLLISGLTLHTAFTFVSQYVLQEVIYRTGYKPISTSAAYNVNGVKFLVAAVVALGMLSGTAYAQTPIRASADRLATEMAATMAPHAAARDALDDAIDVKWLKFGEGFFVAGQIADSISTWYMLGKKDADGNRVYEEGNPFLPDNRVGIVVIKVAAIGAGVAIAEQLWKDGHKWQAVAVMGLAGAVSFGAAGNNVLTAYHDGQLPWQPTTVASRRR